jgi:hypothetical protein
MKYVVGVGDHRLSLKTKHPSLVAVLVAVAANLIMIFGSAWLGLGPALGFMARPYGWILAAQIGMPCLALSLVWIFPRWYSLFHGATGRFLPLQGDDKRVSLIAFFFPTAFTLTTYYEYVSLVNWSSGIPFACLVGGVFFAAAAIPDSDLRTKEIGPRIDLAIGVLLALAYGYAAVLQLNCVLDQSPAAVYRAVVSGKSDRGRGWHLEVEPWGIENEVRTTKVPHDVFKSVQTGDQVCIVLKQGALRMNWYTVQACPWNGGPILFEAGGSL